MGTTIDRHSVQLKMSNRGTQGAADTNSSSKKERADTSEHKPTTKIFVKNVAFEVDVIYFCSQSMFINILTHLSYHY